MCAIGPCPELRRGWNQIAAWLPTPRNMARKWIGEGAGQQNGALRGNGERLSRAVWGNTVGDRLSRGRGRPDTDWIWAQSSEASADSEPWLSFAAMSPALERMAASMAFAMSGFWRMKFLAFSRPWPMRSPL